VFKVFLAHSSKNMDMVFSLVDMLRSAKVDVYVAELNPEPGEYIDAKIKRNLQQSNALLALLTKEGVNSDWVWREIRHAIENDIMVIPLIEKGIEIPPILKDIDCLIFERENYMAAYQTIDERIIKLNKRKQKMIAEKVQPSVPEMKNTDVALIILGAVLLFIVVVLAVEASKG